MDIFTLSTSLAGVVAEAPIEEGRQGLKIWAYAGFIGVVLAFLALDLGVFHRHAHEVSMREAVAWSAVWLTCGVAFSAVVYFAYHHHWLGLGLNTPIYTPSGIERGEVGGKDAAQQYLTGYVIEKSLAMDNIFVIAMVFNFFAVPARYQHRVLFWGILGALIMRGGMIAVGGALVQQYMWVLIIFGLFLLFTSLKMMIVKGESDPSRNPVVRLVRRVFPVADFYDGQRFFTRRTVRPTYSPDPATGEMVQDPPPPGTLSARRMITPLFLALVLVEVTDLIFAVDSIPAIFAITPDPFLVFTSNILAILGLRSLYFCLAAAIVKFRYLKPALILILAFVGVKLLLLSVPPYLDEIGGFVGLKLEQAKSIKVDTTVSLVAVLATLALAVVASVLRRGRAPGPAH